MNNDKNKDSICSDTWSYLHEPRFAEDWNLVVVDDMIMKADKEKENRQFFSHPCLFLKCI